MNCEKRILRADPWHHHWEASWYFPPAGIKVVEKGNTDKGRLIQKLLLHGMKESTTCELLNRGFGHNRGGGGVQEDENSASGSPVEWGYTSWYFVKRFLLNSVSYISFHVAHFLLSVLFIVTLDKNINYLKRTNISKHISNIRIVDPPS